MMPLQLQDLKSQTFQVEEVLTEASIQETIFPKQELTRCTEQKELLLHWDGEEGRGGVIKCLAKFFLVMRTRVMSTQRIFYTVYRPLTVPAVCCHI